VVGAGIVGRGAGAEAGAVSSVANCRTDSEAVRSLAAAGSTLGQAMREFILSARRVGRWTFEFFPTVGPRLVSGRAVFGCLGLGVDVARRMRGFLVLTRRVRYREIGSVGLVRCALRGRGTGKKPNHRGG